MDGLCIHGWSAGFQCRENLLENLPGEQKPNCCSLGATGPASRAAGQWCWAGTSQGAERTFPGRQPESPGQAAPPPSDLPNTVGPH